MSESPGPTPQAVSYPLDRVFQVRNDLRQVWSHDARGRGADDRLLGTLAAHAYDRLRQEIAGLDYGVVLRSLRDLRSGELTGRRLGDAAWRLAGNLPELRRDREVLPWAHQKIPEWVPAQVLSCEPLARGPGGRRHRFRFQILAGSPCPRVASAVWGVRTCQFLARRFGFTRPRRDGRNPSPFRAPEEFVTLRLRLLIERGVDVDGNPWFKRVGFESPALVAWNREQLRFRARDEPGYGCPFDQPRALPCFLCPVGWKECRVGTHRDTYASRPCTACGEDAAPFASSSADCCVNCERARHRGGRES